MALTKISGEVIQSGINIGIVTATQVNVGSAVTIHSGGFSVGGSDLHSTGITVRNVNSTGVITATSFVGDGTNLTNTGSTLSAASGSQRVVLTGQTSGTMTASATSSSLSFNASTGTLSATKFIGDGSALTGIAATTNVRTNSLVVSGVTTATGGINVGDSFIRSTSIGIGTTNTTGRNAGVGTATGTIIFNLTTQTIEAYGVGIGTQATRNGWFPIKGVGSGISTSPGTTSGQQIFTSSGTFIVPEGVYKIRVWLTGGGGGGGGAAPSRGGSGGQTGVKTIYVTPGQSISIVIGSGGKGEGSPAWLGPSPTNWGKSGNGGQSSFGSYLTASGGTGGDGPITSNPPLGAPQPVGSDSGFDFLIYGGVGHGNASNPTSRSIVGGHSYFGVGGGGGAGTVYYAGAGYQGGGGGTGLYLGGGGGSGYCFIEWDNI